MWHLESPKESPGRLTLACARESTDLCVDSITLWGDDQHGIDLTE